jgi:hypothetical protein
MSSEGFASVQHIRSGDTRSNSGPHKQPKRYKININKYIKLLDGVDATRKPGGTFPRAPQDDPTGGLIDDISRPADPQPLPSSRRSPLSGSRPTSRSRPSAGGSGPGGADRGDGPLPARPERSSPHPLGRDIDCVHAIYLARSP